MSKYQIVNYPWPCKGGSVLVPIGQVLDDTDPTYNGTTLPLPFPINCQPLDAGAYAAMRAVYPDRLIPGCDASIVRTPDQN